KVNKAYQVGNDCARVTFIRVSNDQRGSQTPVSNFALEIGKAAAVVRPEEDDGVIHFTRLFQLAQAFAYPVIHFRDIRIESRNIPAYTVRVGVEGRHLHLVGANAQRSVVSRPD